MSRRSIVSGAVLAAGLGLLVTVLTTDSSVLSLEVWIGSTLAWFGVVVAVHLARSHPVSAPALRPMWRRSSVPSPPTYRPSVLATTDRVVAGSLRQDRLFETRLQPRLAALIEQSGRDIGDLGEAARLVEASPDQGSGRATGRLPTMPELVAILDLAEETA